MSLIEISNLHKSYYIGKLETKVLIDLVFNANPGEMVMVMGPSGCGKTTLLNLLGGIDKPTKGTITVAGSRLDELNAKQLNKFRRTEVGFIFQFYNLIPTLTALENVILGIEAVIQDKTELRIRAEKYMTLVGLADKMHNIPQELSAGEQQRVAIARALAKEPKLVLADEPTGNLDSENTATIYKIFREINQQYGTTFLIVTHDRRIAEQTDRIVEIKDGRIVVDINK